MRLHLDSTSGRGYLFVVVAWVKIMVSLILLQDLSTFCIGAITMPFTRGTPLCNCQYEMLPLWQEAGKTPCLPVWRV